MKTNKKMNLVLPEVHIQGDLQDAINLVSSVTQKKTIILFRDGEEGGFYADIKGKNKKILQEEIAKMERKFKLIYFTFFPSRKSEVTVDDVNPGLPLSEKGENSENAEKKKKVKGKGKGSKDKKPKKTDKKDKK